MNRAKAFEIPKELIWKSYQEVRANKGSPGYDQQTILDFDLKRDRNLYKIWNRLCSGSYFPPPVLAKEIPKADGGSRVLGIPTVGDRIAQGAVKNFLENIVEPIFHDDSYGYRPNRSAHQALAKTAERCKGKFWVLEVDIKKFFDNVDHSLVLKALKHLNVPLWVLLYCGRWMTADMITSDGQRTTRDKGTPQGGVVSPILANLFLHYAIDSWMKRIWPQIEFARYADDFIFHCKTMNEAASVRRSLSKRLREVGLVLSVTQKRGRLVLVKLTETARMKYVGYLTEARISRGVLTL